MAPRSRHRQAGLESLRLIARTSSPAPSKSTRPGSILSFSSRIRSAVIRPIRVIRVAQCLRSLPEALLRLGVITAAHWTLPSPRQWQRRTSRAADSDWASHPWIARRPRRGSARTHSVVASAMRLPRPPQRHSHCRDPDTSRRRGFPTQRQRAARAWTGWAECTAPGRPRSDCWTSSRSRSPETRRHAARHRSRRTVYSPLSPLPRRHQRSREERTSRIGSSAAPPRVRAPARCALHPLVALARRPAMLLQRRARQQQRRRVLAMDTRSSPAWSGAAVSTKASTGT